MASSSSSSSSASFSIRKYSPGSSSASTQSVSSSPIAIRESRAEKWLGRRTSTAFAGDTTTTTVSSNNNLEYLQQAYSSNRSCKTISSISSLSDSTEIMEENQMLPIGPGGPGKMLPARLIYKRGDLPIKVVTVDIANNVAYVIFMDDETKAYRDAFNAKMQEDYSWRFKQKATAVQLEDVLNGHIYITQDVDKKFRRAKVAKDINGKISTRMTDVDTFEVFRVGGASLSFYKMDKELEKIWFQVVECQMVMGRSDEDDVKKDWRKDLGFLLKNKVSTGSALLCALETHDDGTVLATDVEIDDKVFITVDVEDAKLRNSFIQALMYYAVPRLPTIGEEKIAVITNVKENGDVDIAFCPLFYDLQDCLARVQIHNDAYGPRPLCSPNLLEVLKDMDSIIFAKTFVAPLKDDWTELFRVKVIEKNEAGLFRIKYLDSGKELWIHQNDFHKMATFGEGVPECLKKLPPQATTVRINDLKIKQVDGLKRCKGILEGQACFLKTVAVPQSGIPLVEMYIKYFEKVEHVLDLAIDASPGTELGFTLEDKEAQKIRQNSANQYSFLPLDSLGEQLYVKKKSRKNEIRAAAEFIGSNGEFLGT